MYEKSIKRHKVHFFFYFLSERKVDIMEAERREEKGGLIEADGNEVMGK